MTVLSAWSWLCSGHLFTNMMSTAAAAIGRYFVLKQGKIFWFKSDVITPVSGLILRRVFQVRWCLLKLLLAAGLCSTWCHRGVTSASLLHSFLSKLCSQHEAHATSCRSTDAYQSRELKMPSTSHMHLRSAPQTATCTLWLTKTRYAAHAD